MPDFVQTAPVDTTTRGLFRGMAAKTATKHDFLWILLVRLPRWLLLHPVTTLALAAAAWLWTQGLPFWLSLAFAVIAHLCWTERHGFLGLLASVVRRREFRRILPVTSNWWRIRTGWPTGTTAIGFRQPGRGGRVPWLRRWEVTATGLAAQATPGVFGWTALRLAGGAETLAAGIKKCRRVTVTEGSTPGLARLDFMFADPLATEVPITALELPEERDMLTVGVTEHGKPATVLPHLHMLVVGLPGSGKSNFLWTLIAGAMQSGDPFELWVLDPADGVELWELSQDSPIVKEYASTGAKMRELIFKLAQECERRANYLRGKGRYLRPSPEWPRIFVICDEEVTIRNHLQYHAKHERSAEDVRVEIASKSRKYGITFVSLTQIPFGHTIGEQIRSLYPQKIVFRVNDSWVTAGMFGAGAEATGTAASKIRADTPGIGYILLRSQPAPVRFRTPYIPDGVAAVLARGILPDGIPAVDFVSVARDNRTHILYRYDTPPEGVTLDSGEHFAGCLYVGISVDGVRRADEHLSDARKAPFRNADVSQRVVRVFTVESCAVELEQGMTVKQVAEAAEAALIRELEPPLNVAHNPGRKRRARAAVGT